MSDIVENLQKKEPTFKAHHQKTMQDKRKRLIARTEFHQFCFDTLLSVTVFQTLMTYTVERNLIPVGRI
ncbi:hypothetical protein O163_06630 [Caldanaerobacter subterraneus subsp. yonseiensis KB-1]|uniref:Uncharacterized protein n=1 Tax=Caldanaerobacter subterraneus subsp. yonseiensis KB-1 TaxID=1388761 RepID=U5CGT8_CALSX|nr:hypothetical protein O163_06630 [Caldanaerobacter subterraneus subsp. yonseiensis KB-1]